VGAAPWVAIGIYLVDAGIGPGGPPGFVYGIYGSIFVFFNVFALNMALASPRRWPGGPVSSPGRWRCSCSSRSSARRPRVGCSSGSLAWS
jgi:hypothetical protein